MSALKYEAVYNKVASTRRPQHAFVRTVVEEVDITYLVIQYSILQLTVVTGMLKHIEEINESGVYEGRDKVQAFQNIYQLSIQ